MRAWMSPRNTGPSITSSPPTGLGSGVLVAHPNPKPEEVLMFQQSGAKDSGIWNPPSDLERTT